EGFEMDAIINRQSDGMERYIYIRCEAAKNQNNQTIRLKGIVQDITERKKAEHESKKNRDLIQSTFDTSLMQMYVLEAVYDKNKKISDFRILIANKEHERETGRTDLIG